MPLFQPHFCSTQISSADAWIDYLVIFFHISNYSVFAFTVVTIPFGLTWNLTVFAISSAMIYFITPK